MLKKIYPFLIPLFFISFCNAQQQPLQLQTSFSNYQTNNQQFPPDTILIVPLTHHTAAYFKNNAPLFRRDMFTIMQNNPIALHDLKVSKRYGTAGTTTCIIGIICAGLGIAVAAHGVSTTSTKTGAALLVAGGGLIGVTFPLLRGAGSHTEKAVRAYNNSMLASQLH